MIKESFFYINYFSLIISYHSLWLGFELFGLRVQAYSQLVQFTLVRKEYDNHHCDNKPNCLGFIITMLTGVWMIECGCCYARKRRT